MPNVVVANGWLTVDGVKVAVVRICHQSLEFKDPDRRRAAQRGSALVSATPAEIAQALQSALAKPDAQGGQPPV